MKKERDDMENVLQDDNLQDDLQPEYDIKNLRVHGMGTGRKSFGGTVVALEPDAAAIFGSAAAVNEALRFLIKITKNNAARDDAPTAVPAGTA